jgi:tetratricopeptide (TPR) repeat protein
MKDTVPLKSILRLGILSSTVLISGCSNYRVGSQIQAGRQDLLIGKSESAVAYFHAAAAQDPSYTRDIGYMREGVWTYLGRANYDAGKLPEARQALQRAVGQDDHDYLAKLYLGLALARTENRDLGRKSIQSGLQGLHDWFEYTKRNSFYGQFWDPSRVISSEIDADLAMISNRDIDWPKIITSGEWVGKKMEEEIDLARRDESHEYDRDGAGRRMMRH